MSNRKLAKLSLLAGISALLFTLGLNQPVNAFSYKNWPADYKSEWKMHTLTAKELETVVKYYPSSSDNSSKCPGRKNGVGTICYPTTYYGQGGTITKNYLAFSVFNGDNGNNYIYFADRKSPYKVQKVISGNWKHQNSFYYSWDTNAFLVDETTKCYSGINGNLVPCKKEDAAAWSGMGRGLTWQGRAEFKEYVALAVWDCHCTAFGQKISYQENENAIFIYKTKDKQLHKTLHIPKSLVDGEIEDISFDSNGDLYIYYNGHHPYTLSWYRVKGSVIASDLGGGSSSGGQDKDPEVIIAPPRKAQCATILLPWCEKAEDDGEATINSIIRFVIGTITVGITVLGTIGIIYSGFLFMTARENQAQVTKAKQRIIEIVIGFILWALAATIISFFLPSDSGEELNATINTLYSKNIDQSNNQPPHSA